MEISRRSWPIAGTHGCIFGGRDTSFVMVTATRRNELSKKKVESAPKFAGVLYF
jgi:hypothetical protein